MVELHNLYVTKYPALKKTRHALTDLNLFSILYDSQLGNCLSFRIYYCPIHAMYTIYTKYN